MEFEGHWLEQQELSSTLSSILALFRVYFTDNHDGVITDQEPDILECEVKWAL